MPLDFETQQAISKAVQQSEEKIQRLINSISAQYVKQDTWFQKVRRDHPIATQNVFLFGGMIVWGGLGFLVGKAW